MKIILKNSSLVFEKPLSKVFLDSYDAFYGQMTNSGNIGDINTGATSNRNIVLYDVSDFAGGKLNVIVYRNISESSQENYDMFSFSTTEISRSSITQNNVIVMNNGVLTTEGLSKEWGIPGKPDACCKVSGEITIPANSKSMAIYAGNSTYTEVDYPDNTAVFYYVQD